MSLEQEDELQYKIHIQPALIAVMNQVESDAKEFGISDDHINRGVYRWVMERMIKESLPNWYMQELDEIEELGKNE